MVPVDEIKAFVEEVVREFERSVRLALERVGQTFSRWLTDLLPRMPCDSWRDELDRIIANLAREQVFIDQPSRDAMIAWLENANQAANRDIQRAAAPRFEEDPPRRQEVPRAPISEGAPGAAAEGAARGQGGPPGIAAGLAEHVQKIATPVPMLSTIPTINTLGGGHLGEQGPSNETLVLRVNLTIFYNANATAGDARARFGEASQIWEKAADIRIQIANVRVLNKAETTKLLSETYGMRPDYAADGYWNLGRIPAGTPSYNPVEVFFLNHISPYRNAKGVTEQNHGIIQLNGETSTGHTAAHEVGHALGLGALALGANGRRKLEHWGYFAQWGRACQRPALAEVDRRCPTPGARCTKLTRTGAARTRRGRLIPDGRITCNTNHWAICRFPLVAVFDCVLRSEYEHVPRCDRKALRAIAAWYEYAFRPRKTAVADRDCGFDRVREHSALRGPCIYAAKSGQRNPCARRGCAL